MAKGKQAGLDKTAKYPRKLERIQAVENFFRDPRFMELLGDDRVVLFDGGAKGGVQHEWIPLRPLLDVIAFEPLWPFDEEERRIGLEFGDEVEPPKGHTKFKTFPSHSTLFSIALGKERGRRTFHEMRGPSMSSFLRAERERWDLYGLGHYTRLMRVFDVETTTLDAIVAERGLRFVDFVKLDTQGSELDILLGAPRTISELAFGLRVETAFVPLYEGQPYFADVDSFVRQRGFEFIDFVHHKRLHRLDPQAPRNGPEPAPKQGGQLVQADPLYLRAPGFVVAHMTDLDDAERDRYLAGALATCLAYARTDYALALVELTRPIVSPKTADTARELVLAYPR